MSKIVYLAGPINGCSDAECADWRADASRLLAVRGVDVLNPMRRDYRGTGMTREVAKHVVAADLGDIFASDALLVNANTLRGASWGTPMEVLFAWGLHKPIVAFDDTAKSLWLRVHADAIVATVEDGVNTVCRVLLRHARLSRRHPL